MTKVEIYTTKICPYCVRAKHLFKRKNIEFTEIRIDLEEDKDARKHTEMLVRSGGRKTVPQIFINNVLIGGCDDLYALESQHKLDNLLDGSHH